MRVAIIPARAGSRRIPGKNWKLFHGRPIITYSIEAARACGLFDMVVVTTDSPEVEKIALTFKGLPPVVSITRAPDLAQNEVGTQEVTKRTILQIEGAFDIHVYQACCIYATAPMISCADLTRGLEAIHGHCDYAYTVDRDLKDAGQFYWGDAEAFKDDTPLDGNSYLVVIPDDRVQDINTPEDWALAERMYTALKEREKNGTH